MEDFLRLCLVVFLVFVVVMIAITIYYSLDILSSSVYTNTTELVREVLE